MNLIQLILVVGLLAVATVYFSRVRSQLWNRFLVITIICAGVLLVAYPDFATRLAHLLGVGRGTDLILYGSLLGVGFVLVLLYSWIREVQQQVTALAREIAILEAERIQEQRRAAEGRSAAETGCAQR